ncbi:MAG TPA: F0F1 ATP synthase subunit B [Gemmatimonadaceae bacterium]|nr:F0F1 ATP synthase subunit B [Gemmatimonadaceae bacterium]
MMNLALSLLRLQEHAASPGLVSLRLNLMFWTLVIFLILWLLLQKLAFPAILGLVEKREKALEDAIESAKRDRDEAARILADHRAQLEGARGEAQKLIADARGTAEKMRADLLEKTRQDQQELIERARREIAAERDKAIVELRREAVDLAIAGAGKVVEENLDNDKNRKLVEAFLSSLGNQGGQGGQGGGNAPSASPPGSKNGRTGKR